MHLLYASQQAAGKRLMVFAILVCEKNDPLWLNARIHALVRHNSGAKNAGELPRIFCLTKKLTSWPVLFSIGGNYPYVNPGETFQE